jgi:integrase
VRRYNPRPSPRQGRRISFVDVPEFVAKLRATESIHALALEFLILTAGRAGEVLGAIWDEIDSSAQVWVIPAPRMKAEREHRVPLSMNS